MLYYLHLLTEWFSPLRVFRYITFRALAGAGTAFIICLIVGPWMIRMLRRLKMGQPIRRSEAPPLVIFHGKKEGTPTMGGVLIILSVVISTLLWTPWSNGFVWIALLTMCFMGGIGFRDDFLKVTKKNTKGLGARSKLFWQLAWVVVVFAVLLIWPTTREQCRQLMVPFLKDPLIQDLGLIGTFLFLALVMVGSTNAVNLTDGLDGLAIGCSNSVALAYLVMAYIAGHAGLAKYLQVPYIPGTGELAVFCGCLLGAGLGFLWYNCHPARVFMGDTGSLALGGAISIVAVLINQELALILVGGVFVAEALSVLLQVSYFKLTGGRRIFKCSPLHHHFEVLEKERAEKEGRDVEVVETMITIRFWILSIICALLGVAMLKLR
ncbi:MAG TPA: phospho-N-acetylmuramoyl-pentapeptide-transferase [Verrucomicrobia bacterium]|nr:MAG: phospho-N-acetylmuramoyl-pentapeptide-transferase [Lentisphaerae bacterium GWF2_57_35]HBA83523.1 phospho-N-acetylmuramoyl-pentapeptide-transferase [Verrucomicrobiota bacterium]